MSELEIGKGQTPIQTSYNLLAISFTDAGKKVMGKGDKGMRAWDGWWLKRRMEIPQALLSGTYFG